MGLGQRQEAGSSEQARTDRIVRRLTRIIVVLAILVLLGVIVLLVGLDKAFQR